MFSLFGKKPTAKFTYVATGKVIKVSRPSENKKIKISFKWPARFWAKCINSLENFYDSHSDGIKVFVALAIVVGLVILLIRWAYISDKENAKKKETIITNMVTDATRKAKEQAYFEGQRDAITGDIRIKLVDSTWVWIKSPWDDGKQPTFHPNVKGK